MFFSFSFWIVILTFFGLTSVGRWEAVRLSSGGTLTSILRERREQQWSNLWLGLIGISFLLLVLSLLVGLFVWLHSQVQPGAAALMGRGGESTCTHREEPLPRETLTSRRLRLNAYLLQNVLDVVDPGGQRLCHFGNCHAFEIGIHVEAFAGSLLFFAFLLPCLVEALGADLRPGRDPGYLRSQVIGFVSGKRRVADDRAVQIPGEEFAYLAGGGDLRRAD